MPDHKEAAQSLQFLCTARVEAHTGLMLHTHHDGRKLRAKDLPITIHIDLTDELFYLLLTQRFPYTCQNVPQLRTINNNQ